MRYQLVLQFPATTIQDYDELVALEARLIDSLSESDFVDGHDMGRGEFNIFLLTDDPRLAFNCVQPIITTSWPAQLMKVAYRQLDKEEYVTLWSPSLDNSPVS